MPYSDSDTVSSSTNRLIMEELEYDITLLKKEFDSMFHALTNEQRNIFLDIMTTVNDNKGGVFFVYGYGGTGKTFLWKTLFAAIRCNGDIVLNVASSGIASLLLPGGRIAHSRFIIPLNLTEYSVLRKSSLIIWDEAPMVHKHAFEALDRALRDVCKFDKSTNSDIPFGGKAIVFGGDFRQILPVVQGGSRQNIVNASLSSSYIWQHCQSEFIHDQFDPNLYSPNILNGLKVSGLPNHKLILKVGVPVMLLRNIDQKNGLCNGTRLQVKSLGKRVIEAIIISGTNIGKQTFILRMSLSPSEKKIPFKFQRRQFPLAVCFAMTINKSQGQSLSKVGLYLKDPVFSYGQLYVALSRVQSREGLKLLILDNDGRLTNKTSNVVYKEVFRNL
ncbi:uncharacterized protein LOC128126869 [Lactuca sativa]|uniref:uncharacterized protein LOC128126869 n=1 Tax=Lactuca sativa TaxID=4236 RepID=UPI0022AE8B93|nr:uncharacterized protein LOC128126869 [Lactuca sativa]